MKAGLVDAIIIEPYSSALVESEKDVCIHLNPNDTEKIAKINEIAPYVEIAPFTDAFGMEKKEEVYGFSYQTPFGKKTD